MRFVVYRASVIVFVALIVMAGEAARGQGCVVTSSRTAPPGLNGLPIRTMAVRVDPTDSLAPTARLRPLRTRTQNDVVSRQLLLHVGGVVDSTLLAESLRRVRALRLFTDVSVDVTRCDGRDSVDLAVVAIDAWTLRPIARVTPPATVSLGLEDRDLFGSGKTLSVTSDQTSRGHGGSIGATDPWLLGTDAVGTARFSDLAGTHMLRGGIRHDERSYVDPWRYEIASERLRLPPVLGVTQPLGTFSVVGLVGHMVGDERSAIVVPYATFDVDQAQGAVLNSTTALIRKFAGAGVGLSDRAAQFDTVGWFVPGHGLVDIPLGWQADVFTAAGYDRAQHADAAHYDAWLGRMWIPSRGTLITADAWTYGYVGNVRQNHLDRFSMSLFAESRGGFWAARVMSEQLLGLDPDLHALSLATSNADPSFGAVPTNIRTASRSVVSSIERSFHLRYFGRASVLDGALFSAGSMRWDADSVGTLRVAVAGVRARLLSANGVLNSTRVEVSYPVIARGHSVVHRPLLTVSVASLLDAPHQRDGRRRP